ncbi:N-acetylmuramoyl-L-alanine amidase family protein [Halobacillus ihumii]|uniref:N-acetylmuramoyl-L-alanine amidase family protein n=1 Tax=Halobacillus ihumii TaxID=2686092 RepID=UPI0013CF4C24|nr:N-acetylmuramoyl-L-alanine amidase [Halobacillus ihumii]
MAFKLALGGGHGANTPGKRTPKFDDGTYMNEHDFNYPTACYVEENLVNEYEDVEIVRVDDEVRDVPLIERTNKANAEGADAYVSIHANAMNFTWGEPAPRGIETYAYVSEPPEAMELAEKAQDEMIDATGLFNRGVKTANFHVLRETHMSAILVECGFMDNKEEARLLMSDEYRRTCARAITNAIAAQYGLKKRSNPKPAAPKPTYETYVIDENIGNYRLESKVADLRFYVEPSWADADVFGRIDEGVGFPTIVRKLQVGDGEQYEVQNSDGATFYITAADVFVQLIEKEEDEPWFIGKRVECKVGKLRFYSRPSWDDSALAGHVTEGIGFPNILDKLTVGAGEQYEVANSDGDVFYITASDEYVRVE